MPGDFYADEPKGKKKWGKGEQEAPQIKVVRCNDGIYGCGQTFPMQPDGQGGYKKTVNGYNAAVNLCLACSNRIAREWGVPFLDVHFITFATSHAQSIKGGLKPTREEIQAILTDLQERLRRIQNEP